MLSPQETGTSGEPSQSVENDYVDPGILDKRNVLVPELKLLVPNSEGTELEWDIKSLSGTDKGQNSEVKGEEDTKECGRIQRRNLSETKRSRCTALERLMAARQNKQLKMDEQNKFEEYEENSAVEEKVDDVDENLDSIVLEEKISDIKSKAKKTKLKAKDIYSDVSSDSEDEVMGSTKMSCTSTNTLASLEMTVNLANASPRYARSSLMGIADFHLITIDDIRRCLLTRFQLEFLIEKPIFEKTVVNCYVRVSVGVNNSTGLFTYRLAKIVRLEKTNDEYYLGLKKCEFDLRLQHGSQQKNFRIDLVSNQPLTEQEFQVWVAACQTDGERLPPVAGLKMKEADIKSANEYQFTEHDVDKILAAKKAKGISPVSSAYRKVCLILDRDVAIAKNDMKRAKEVDKLVDEIDKKTREQDQMRLDNLYNARSAKVKKALMNTVTMPCWRPPPVELPAKLSSNELALRAYMCRKYQRKTAYSVQEGSNDNENSKRSNMSSTNFSKMKIPPLKEVNPYELHNFSLDLNIQD